MSSYMAELTAKLKSGEIDEKEFQQKLNQAMTRENQGIADMKIGEKKGLVVRQKSRRYPTTLYGMEWIELIGGVPQIIQKLYDEEHRLDFKSGVSLPDKKEFVKDLIENLKTLVK